MPETIRLTLDFDKQKYNGLSKQLKKRNVTVEEALEHNLDGLYERYVPETERKAIAEKTRFDYNLLGNANAPAKKFSVITLRGNDGEMIFKSEIHIIFLDLARIYREKIRDWESVTDLVTLKSFFGKSAPIDPSWMKSIKENYSMNPCITMLADFDFLNDTIRVLKNGSTEWSKYRLKDVASAAFLAYQNPELHLSERRRIFDEYLSDRKLPQQK